MEITEALARAAQVAREVLRRTADHVDREGRWPAEGMRALQAAGLGGLVVPTDAGGLGLGLLATTRLCEVLAQECPSTAISFGMHLVGSAVIAAKATDAQRDRYLEPIARGAHLTTLALSEPGTGSEFYIPEAILEPAEPGTFLLSGTKSFVTNGGFADSYVVSATTPDRLGVGEFSCAIIDRDQQGLSFGPDWTGWGMRGNSACSMTMERLRLPRAQLLGEQGDEIWYVFNVVAPFFLMAMAGTYLGVAEAGLTECKRHLAERVHSHTGTPLAQKTLVQHTFGLLWAEVRRARALLYEAARLGDLGDPDALPLLCSAKAEVSEAATNVLSGVMRLMGGQAYAQGTRVQRLYRDAAAAHIMAPTTEILRIWTGRAVLGLPILGQ